MVVLLVDWMLEVSVDVLIIFMVIISKSTVVCRLRKSFLFYFLREKREEGRGGKGNEDFVPFVLILNFRRKFPML